MTDATLTIVGRDGRTKGSVPMKAAMAAARSIIDDIGRAKMAARTPMLTSDSSPDAGARTVAAGQLRAFIERVERLEEDRKAIADDIKEVFSEMKAAGFDTKAVRDIIRLRKQEPAARQEAEALLDLYKAALGMD